MMQLDFVELCFAPWIDRECCDKHIQRGEASFKDGGPIIRLRVHEYVIMHPWLDLQL